MKIYDIITIILFVVTLVVVLWYIFGDSPTLEQGLLILILTFLFSTYGNVKGQSSRLSSLEGSFGRLAQDFKEHTKKIK